MYIYVYIYIYISEGYASAAGPLVFRACKLGGLKVQRLGGLDVQRTKILQAKKRKGSLLVLLFSYTNFFRASSEAILGTQRHFY